MASVHFIAGICSFVTVVYFYLRRRNGTVPRLPLPPGRKGLPFIGNLRDMPTSLEWKTYHKWCRELDTDIMHLSVAGTSLIVLDTFEAASDLLERRSSVYSDRARLPMINELMGWDFNVGFMPYGNYWRKNRRVMHDAFHPTAARCFHPVILKATHRLLQRLLDNPDDVLGNLRQLAGESIMSIAYGIEVKPKDDPYIKMAEEGGHPLVVAAVPGAFLVDVLPILKYVPEWMPGAGFKKKAKEWKRLARRMVDAPFEASKRDMENGKDTQSFASLSLQKMQTGNDDAYQEEVIKSSAGTLYAAGSDTTISAIASCILGLLEHPSVFQKARSDIDLVVGLGKLPDFDDVDSLPYITAIVKEALRWRNVTPIAIPHFLQKEDNYHGYRIPAGSVIIPNAWAMLHNEEIYPDPFTFNPDRFMKDGMIDNSIKDPMDACFGFGRRICPARHTAFSAIWIAVASLIAVFDIKKAVDKNGNIIELTHEYISALVCTPKPFKCSITARSKEAEALIFQSSDATMFR